MQKLKIMAIAPYEGLIEAIKTAAKAYEDKIELTAVLGNLNQSLVWATDAETRGMDLIISRGGTAELLMECSKLPVINIDVSGYDYIRILKLADNIDGEKAFVGFPSITRRAESINTMLQSDIRIFTIQSYDDLEPLLTDLNHKGYSLIIGDVASCRVAREMAINAMLLTSGTESIVDALELALLTQRFLQPWKEQVAVLSGTIDHDGTGIVVIDEKAKILYSNPAFSLLGVSNTELAGYLGDASAFREQELIVPKGEGFLKIIMKKLVLKDNLCFAMYITMHTYPSTEGTQGIKIYNFKRRGASAATLLNQRGIYDKRCISMSASFSEVDTPFLITGDIGVGKIGMAITIHRLSKRWAQPFIKVNCLHADPLLAIKTFCGDKDVEISLSGGTICFESLESVNIKNQSALLDQVLARDGGNWRFAATSIGDLEELVTQGKMDLELYRYFSQLITRLPGLNESGQNLKNIVNIYIIEANTKYGRQIAGVTGQAMEFIIKHKWSQNFTSLRQAVTQMVLFAKSDYITLDEAKSVVFAREPEKPQAVIDLSGNLEEITQQIIFKVLREENGNQTKTAARLGIGRSTLWRKMSDSTFSL